MDVLLVYSGCSKSQISLEFHSISRDDGACRVSFFFLFFLNVRSRRRMRCFHTLSLCRSTQTNLNKDTHTRTHAGHTLAATHVKTQLAQIIKINTLEAWHYAKETSHLWKKSYKKLLNNLSLVHVFVILTITYILYADEGYTSVVNLWMT